MSSSEIHIRTREKILESRNILNYRQVSQLEDKKNYLYIEILKDPRSLNVL